jgi:hypothetical protein
MLYPQSDEQWRAFVDDEARYRAWAIKLRARYTWDFGWKTGQKAYDLATRFESRADAETVVRQYMNDGGWIWSGGKIVYHPPEEEPRSAEMEGYAVQQFAF